MRHLLSRYLLVSGLMLLCTPPAIAELIIGDYEVVNQKRLSLTEFEYTATAHVTNTSDNELKNVIATLSTTSDSISIVDNGLSFGDVPRGGTVRSINTATIRYDRTKGPLNIADLVWSTHSLVGVGYTDSLGNEVVVYISDAYNSEQVSITEGVNPSSLPDDFPFITNRFIEVYFPEGYAARTAIQVSYTTRPYRVFVFNEDTGRPRVTAFDDSQEGIIEVRSTPDNGKIVFALVGEY